MVRSDIVGRQIKEGDRVGLFYHPAADDVAVSRWLPGFHAGVPVGEPVPDAHHVLDPVLEDEETVLEGVVGQRHVIAHQHLGRQPQGDLVALLPRVPERQLKDRVGYRASIHRSDSLRCSSWLSSRYWSVSADSAAITRRRSATTSKSSIRLTSVRPAGCPPSLVTAGSPGRAGGWPRLATGKSRRPAS
jgi:hypothetical protein